MSQECFKPRVIMEAFLMNENAANFQRNIYQAFVLSGMTDIKEKLKSEHV